MSPQPYDDSVNEQYERWLFPEPIRMLELPVFEDAKVRHCMYWPVGGPGNELCILVAGCGTREAALVAFHNPKAEVVGIDISEASLKHETDLKKQYSLDNLSLRRLAVEEAATLEQCFDLIYCHGVLHHLADPKQGIRQLEALLKPDGVMSIMLYGRYGRFGVHLLHRFFEMIGLDQNPEDLDVVRATLAVLGPHHPARSYISAYRITHDSTMVDTFLNRRECDFTVGECLDLVKEAGLAFQGWVNNELYYPEGRIPRGHPLIPKLSKLPDRDLWSAMELLNAINQHYFLACKECRPRDRYAAAFRRDDVLRYVPVVHSGRLRKLGVAFLESLTVIETELFRRFDGDKSLKDCIDSLGIQGDIAPIEALGGRLVETLWRRGLVHLRMP